MAVCVDEGSVIFWRQRSHLVLTFWIYLCKKSLYPGNAPVFFKGGTYGLVENFLFYTLISGNNLGLDVKWNFQKRFGREKRSFLGKHITLSCSLLIPSPWARGRRRILLVEPPLTKERVILDVLPFDFQVECLSAVWLTPPALWGPYF